MSFPFTEEESGRFLGIVRRMGNHMDWFRYCAREGKLEELEWLHEFGLSMEPMMNHAAEAGRLNVLEWLVKKGHTFGWSTVFLTISCDHLECLKFLKEQDPSLKDHDVLYNALYYHRPEILDWILEDVSATEGRRALRTAIALGKKELILIIKSHGVPWGNGDFAHAAIECGRQFAIWLVENGCPKM